MKPIIQRPACQRCGYKYTPTEEEQKAFLETFKVKEKGEVGENNVRC